MERGYAMLTTLVPRDFPIKTPSAPTFLQMVDGLDTVDGRFLAKVELAVVCAALGFAWSSVSTAAKATSLPAIATTLGIVTIVALPAEEPASTISTAEQQSIAKPKYERPPAKGTGLPKSWLRPSPREGRLVEGPDFVLNRGADGVIRYR